MKLLLVIFGGAIFGAGLALSGMARQEVVLSFLHWEDFGLMLVMGGGVLVTALAFLWVPRLRARPVCDKEFTVWPNVSQGRTMLGAVIFGVGWGLSGLCPGSAIASVGIGNWPVLLGIGGMLAGAWVKGLWIDRSAQ